MRLRRHHPQPDDFDRREILCESEAAAKAEAERQQELEPDDDAEWVYLRPEATGQWIARRTQRHPDIRYDIWDRLIALFGP
jgi:hypothetical protein